jgi:serine/threonine protein kinase
MATVATTTTASTGILIFYIQDESKSSSSSSASSFFFLSRTYCDASSASAATDNSPLLFRMSHLRRRATIRQMEKTAARESFASQYRISKLLGEGAFGKVYLGEHIATEETVAIKRINKECTDNITFQREMDALLRLREKGCHPNICSMRGTLVSGSQHRMEVVNLTIALT